MKKKQRSFKVIIIVFALIIAILAVGGFIVSKNGVLGRSGVDIEIITGAGGMPPDESPGKLLTGEQFTVGITEPFSSLENWQASKVLREVRTTSGKASINIAAGKYGIYYIYNGHKTLYDGLNLENPRNDIQRDKQGPWYIRVNYLQRTKLRFSVNTQPV